MKVLAAVVALASLAPLAQAADYARVVGRSEITERVPVAREVCRTEEIEAEAPRSAGGAIIGGIAGGVLGHSVGRGSGRAAATAIGAITGAVVGDRIDNRGAAPSRRQVERCDNEPTYEERVVGYRITYEYAGKRYTTRMAQDPGRHVEVRVIAVGSEDDAPASASRADSYSSRPDEDPQGDDEDQDRDEEGADADEDPGYRHQVFRHSRY